MEAEDIWVPGCDEDGHFMWFNVATGKRMTEGEFEKRFPHPLAEWADRLSTPEPKE